MDKKLLKSLYAIHSPSLGEDDMRDFLVSYIEEIGVNCKIDETGNVYATKGDAETYPCVVAHMDQVQRLHSADFRAYESGGIIYGYSRRDRRFEGLGADDKNGIFVALECLKEFDILKCAFFVGEEIGCVGSESCDISFFDDCRFVLQCDRRGGSDLITEISDELCSGEFLSDTDYALWGYSTTCGLMTDVDTLKRLGLGVSCVNISCGYYEPHTDNEFTVLSELENCLNFVRSIIRNCAGVYYHVLSHPKDSGYSWHGGGRDFAGYHFCDGVWEVV